MKPYYQTDDGSIRIYHARWEDVLAAGVFKPKDIALVHADPPYGGGELAVKLKPSASDARLTRKRVFAPIVGDQAPFDPAPLLALDRPSVLWGANHYSDRVPGGPSWLFWDKRVDVAPDNQADGEMAWSNLGGPLRTFRGVWRGFLRPGENGSHLHPTQKPEALSAWVFAHATARKKLKKGDTVLIPYMGSGPDLRPAQAMGFNVIACEVSQEYCDTAINARLRSVAGPIDNSKLGLRDKNQTQRILFGAL